MKKLFIIRHGETQQPQGSTDDFKRELSSMGKFVLTEKVKKIIKLDVFPELIVCSDLLRTRQTLAVFLQCMQLSKAGVVYDHGFYNKEYDYLFSKLYETGDNINNLMFIGHDPQVSELASELLHKPVKLQMGEIIGIESESEKWTEFCAEPCRELFYL
jgi:phosphohistidine phosphatase